MEDTDIGTVTAIWRYPVSSAGGEKIHRAYLNTTGIQHDRSFAIFDDETLEPVHPARKQWHSIPRLLARLDDSNGVEISMDRDSWFKSDEPQLRHLLSSLYGRALSVHRYGIEINGHLTAHRYALSPVHVMSRQSLELLKSLLPKSLIDERRFRPNIVMDLPDNKSGTPPEYQLIGREFKIGNLRLRGVKACGRCSFTTLEQFGIPEDRSVLRTLITQFEKDFGIYCDVVDEGWISSGDRVSLCNSIAIPPSVVIIGGGQSGGTLARELRALVHEGAIDIFGDERHAPYERPPLSKSFEPLDGPQQPLTPVLSSMDAQALDIGLHLDEHVVRIDRESKTVETADGVKHPYDYLVIATGGSARRIAMLNRGHGRTHSIRTLDDAGALRRALKYVKRIFVVGGGWLGLEIATAARKISVDVSVFVRQSHVCSRVLPTVVADFIEDVHVRNGVRFHMNQEPEFIEYPDRIEAYYAGRIEQADLLIVAIGINANDYLARHAGLECSEGIVTDANGATSDPFIFAIGDVSCQRSSDYPQGIRIESWQNAIEQAGRAARAILKVEIPPAPVPRFWSDQYDLTIQIAGMPDPSAVPVAVDGRLYPYWQFRDFAIGINRAKEIHQFALQRNSSLQTRELKDIEQVDDLAPKNETRYLLENISQILDGQFFKTSNDHVGDIVIAHLDGQYFAIQDQCPHAQASLSEGFLEGRRLVCPLHFAEFDLANGAAYNAPKGCPNARTYRIEVDGGLFYIWLPDLPPE